MSMRFQPGLVDFLGVHQAHMSKTLGRFRLKPESVECLKKKRTNHGGLNYHIFKKHPRWLFGWCFPWRQSSPKSGYENLLFHEQISSTIGRVSHVLVFLRCWFFSFEDMIIEMEKTYASPPWQMWIGSVVSSKKRKHINFTSRIITPLIIPVVVYQDMYRCYNPMYDW